MLAEFVAIGERLAMTPEVRVVVLSGAGRSFCTVLDVAAFAETAADEDGDEHAPHRAVLVWRDMPVPVIVALHGVAFGRGGQIALGADIRIAAPSSRFQVMKIKWGLVADMASTVRMRQLAPLDLVKELSWTGRIFNRR